MEVYGPGHEPELKSETDYSYTEIESPPAKWHDALVVALSLE